MSLRFLSLFSGIEAATCAWNPLGWECAAVAEVEPFPCSLLKHHYPKVPNLGDVTKITADQIKALGHIDLVCGGFPCQDLSVAGKRKGLNNADGTPTRSGLFFDAMRIADWANPRWLFIENVPGMFSSNSGRDFAAVVGEMAGCEFAVPRDGWRNAGVVVGPSGLVEWSVMDAQYHGLAQRRKRVFIVRDSGDWANRPPIFLEPYRLSGHPAPSREARESVAGPLKACAASGGWSNSVDHAAAGYMLPIAFPANLSATQCASAENISPALGAANPTGVAYSTKLHNTSSNQAGKFYREYATRLDANSPPPAVVFDVKRGLAPHGAAGESSTAFPLAASEHKDPQLVRTAMQVRRLTPTECERLQGFPDGYTAIPWRKKPASECPDGPRYEALGNSWAVPCASWIGQRIEAVAQASPPA